MQWYVNIIFLFLNILFSIACCYLLLIILFHPQKKRKWFPQGPVYLLRDKIATFITDKFSLYLETHPDEPGKTKPEEIAENFSDSLGRNIENKKIFKNLPQFIKKPLLNFVKSLGYELVYEFLTEFIPDLIQRYEIKQKISELLSDERMHWIETKAKYYLTKPLVIMGAALGTIFGIFNMIMLFIF
ncbi:MAG: hypothetical protein ACP5EQ_04110 [Candidatus Cloacimonadia bacterium]